MWAQDWTNIASHVMPFPEEPDFDVTQSMIDNVISFYLTLDFIYNKFSLFP